MARQNKQRLTKEGVGAALRAALQQRSERMPAEGSAKNKAAAEADSTPHLGIKGYRVLRKLGEGGMSQIFLAENTRTGQVGALKVLTVSSDEITDLKLFIKEYDIVSKLDSPHIVRIYDHGVADDHIFIAMEYLPGGNLKERMALGLTTKRSTSCSWAAWTSCTAWRRKSRREAAQRDVPRPEGAGSGGLRRFARISTDVGDPGRQIVGTDLHQPDAILGQPSTDG